MRLVKIAAEIAVSARRVLVRLSGSRPRLDHYREVSERVVADAAPPSGPG